MNPPSFLRTALDIPWGLTQTAIFNTTTPLTPLPCEGDKRAVILIPGLGAHDVQMFGLRNALRRLGYDAHTWGLGHNWGAKTVGKHHEKLIEVIRNPELSGKVTLIGWSLGGLQARMVAHAIPSYLDQVITMGSPFVGRTKATRIGPLFSWLTGEPIEGVEADDIVKKLAKPLRIPSTSIYSMYDGVVAPEGCIDPVGVTKCIEVGGAHTGLATNRKALEAIRETLLN